MTRKLFKATFVFFCFSLLVACSPVTRVAQGIGSQTIALAEKQSVGQTATANYDGLAGVDLYLSPSGEREDGEIRLHMKTSPQAEDEVAQAVLPLSSVTSADFYRFSFSPIAASNQAGYYFYLELSGPGRIEISSGPGNTYPDGSMYVDHKPVDSQITFRLVYDREKMAAGMAKDVFAWVGILLLAGFLFVLPGWALFSLLWVGWKDRQVLEKAALGLGASLALYPILILWTSLIGLHLGVLYALIPPILGAIIMGWRMVKGGWVRPRIDWCSSELWGQSAAVILLGLVVFTRFWPVRSLIIPLWGDSYHHTMIAQLLVDNNGWFTSWAPYADLSGLTYHFGFHVIVAVYAWITRIPVPQAVLWVGQLLNISAILVLYPLAHKIGRSAWAGAGAVLIAGLLSFQPMFYINWGRYTQLAGQVFLPVAVWMIWELLETRPRAMGAWVLTGITWAGLALTHYRVFIIGLLFLPVLLIGIFWRNLRLFPWKQILLIGIMGGLLILPFYLQIFSGKVTADLMAKLSTSASNVSDSMEEYNSIGNIADYLPIYLWALFGLVAAWILLRRERNGLFMVIWAVVGLVACNPSWLRLPGAGVISNFALFIFAYFWVSILVGSGLGYGLELLNRWRPSPVWLYAGLLSVLLIVGASRVPARMNPVQWRPYQLFTRADQRAANWIQQNTPTNARFLVNFLFAYGDTTLAGTDGGIWLPLLAGRGTTVPPMVYGIEKGPFPNYFSWANELPALVREKGIEDPAVLSMMKERGIQYVYLGQQQGGAAATDVPYRLVPKAFLNSPHYRTVYNQDRVWIFEVQP